MQRRSFLGAISLIPSLGITVSASSAAPQSGGKGEPKSFKVTFDKVEANTPIDDTIFAFPALASKETKR